MEPASATHLSPLINCSENRRPLIGHIDHISANAIVGWCLDPLAPGERCRVAISLDGIPLVEGHSSFLRPDVPTDDDIENIAGFRLSIPPHVLVDALSRLLARYPGDRSRTVELAAYAYDLTPLLVDERSELLLAGGTVVRRTLAKWLELWGFDIDHALFTHRAAIYADLRGQVAGNNGRHAADNRAELFRTSMRLTPRRDMIEDAGDRHAMIRRYMDCDYYRGQEPPLPPEIDMVAHYVNEGCKTTRSPHPLFDKSFYLGEFKARLGARPDSEDVFFHFLMHGASLSVDPHPGFSMWWYRERYSLGAEVHPWTDYVSGGWLFDREPNWVFDTRFVLKQLADPSALNRITPLQAYLADPAQQQFAAHPLFAIRRTHEKSAGNDNEGDRYLQYLRRARAGTKFSNGLFDHDHYLSQGEIALGAPDALAHYVLIGEREGRTPNYLFDPDWYRRTYNLTSDLIGPLHDFVDTGSRSLKDPSPYFSTRYYIVSNNDIALNGIVPLLHFLIAGDREGRQPNMIFKSDWYRATGGTGTNLYQSYLLKGTASSASPHPALVLDERADMAAIPEFLHATNEVRSDRPFGGHLLFSHDPDGRVLDAGFPIEELYAFEREVTRVDTDKVRRLKLDEPIVRMTEVFDLRVSDRVAAAATVRPYAGDVAPLVSVIIPTWNRAHVLKRAIYSVLAQTHSAIELIIVDDGSTDGTEVLVGNLADPRITLLRQPQRGVCAARNAGLEAATGTYLAYLDSDNYWEPNYLNVMIRTLQSESREAGHAVLRVYHQQSGAMRYRGDVYDRPSLDRENYIDMNIFVHHRRFIDEGFRFDDTLRRCVDWDLIRRICLVAPSLFVPVIGCNYVDDSGELGRITTSESPGDFYKLMTRQIDLAPHVCGRGRGGAVPFSIIWSISPLEEGDLRVSLWRALHHLRSSFHELIIVNNNLSDQATMLLDALCNRIDGLRVIHLWRDMLQFPAANLATRIAASDRLLFWNGYARYDGTVIEELMADLDATDAVIHPVVVDESRRLVSRLFTASADDVAYQPLMGDQSLDGRVSRLIGAGSEAFPVAMRRERFERLGTFETEFCLNLALVAFGLATLADENDALVVRFDRVFEAQRPLVRYGSEADRRKESDRLHNAVPRIAADLRIVEPDLRIAPLQHRFAVQNERLSSVPAAVTFLPRTGAGRSLRFQIMCPAPSGPEIGSWGDYHYAVSLRAALTELGHECLIRLRDHWKHPSPGVDVALHIRGIVDIQPVPGALNLLWIISHPDKVRATELEAASAIFATSSLLAEQLYRRFGVTCHVLPQATDARLFAFQDTPPAARLASKYLFMGNSRKVSRPIVMDAVQLGLPFEIYGREWEFYLAAEQIAGRFVPNDQVAHLYRSALCTLNDHWPTMARAGIISNRLFDVVAAGGVAISDQVAGIEPLFGDHVRTYGSLAELAELTEGIQDWLPSVQQRREASRRILSEHSFATRARQIVDVVAQL